jgi:hypothetical protein
MKSFRRKGAGGEYREEIHRLVEQGLALHIDAVAPFLAEVGIDLAAK